MNIHVAVGETLLTGGLLAGIPTDVRVRDGVIVEVGPSLVPTHGGVSVDLAGGTLLPGFRDAHTHLRWWAFERTRATLNAQLGAAGNATEAAAAVAEAARDHRGGLLRGYGFHAARWPDEPHRSLLDRAAPGVAVALSSNDAHAGWLSSVALARIGLDHPTGYLRETEWWDAQAELRQPDAAEDDAAVEDATIALAARGVTSVVDIDLDGGWGPWQRRAQHAPMAVRVWCDLVEHELDGSLESQRRSGDAPAVGGGLLVSGHLKLFVDGALGGLTALCDHAYDEAGEDHGQQLMSEDELVGAIARAHAAGIASTVHAIGDAANRIALNAFERAGCGGRIEHAQLVAERDLRRFARLGIDVSVQPAHCPEDRDLTDRWWGGVAGQAYPFRALVAAGARLVAGSDAPVSAPHPLRWIAAAVTRTLDERPPWHPEQALSLDEALAMSSGHRIEVGAPADVAVVAEDPHRVAVGDLPGLPVLRTMVAGRWTYTGD